MNTDTQPRRDYRFALGLLTGTFVGAGIAMWLAPRAAAELRGRLADQATDLGQRASEGYQRASVRVGDAIDEGTRKAQGVRDDLADSVARGAHEVERFAAATKSDRTSESRKRAGTDRPAVAPHAV
jgi:gas vesicle protein